MVQKRDDHTLRTARQAYDAGETRYFTGKPCVHGHVAERMVRNGVCIECLRVRRKAEKVNPEVARKAKEKYRANNLDKIRRMDAEAHRRIRASNPEAAAARQQKWRERRDERKAQIAGRPKPSNCELCKEPAQTVFDHCHASGKFRGWLCDRCNRTLGQVKDQPWLLRAMANYLEAHHGGSHLKAA